MKTKKQKVIRLKPGMRIVPAKGIMHWKPFTILDFDDTRVVIEHDDGTKHSYFAPSIEVMLKRGHLKIVKPVEHPFDLAEKGKLYDGLKILCDEALAQKLIAEAQRDKLLESFQKIRLLESETNDEWLNEVLEIVHKAIKYNSQWITKNE